MKLLRGLIVILAVCAIVASASMQTFLAEQAELEAMEAYGHLESPDIALHTELNEEDRALSELGIDVAPLSMAETESEAEFGAEAETDAEVDVDVDTSAATEADVASAAQATADEALEDAAMEEAAETGDYPALAIPVIRRDAIPIVSREEAIRSGPSTEARVFTVAEDKPQPTVVIPAFAKFRHPRRLHAMVTRQLANQLLTLMYDKSPISPHDVAMRLPAAARMALLKVLRKTNDPEGQITITASFLAPFTVVESPAAEAEAQARAAALLETDSETVAQLNTENEDARHAQERAEFEAAFPDMPAIGMSALETGTEAEVEVDLDAEGELEAEVDAEAELDAEADAELDAEAEAEVEMDTEFQATNGTANIKNFDAGVGALRKYAETLEGEALVLSKKLEALNKIHRGSIFKAMDRGPVGRRQTPSERQQVFTNGMRAWEAEATSERLRNSAPVSATEADRIYSLEPSPK